ncbi:retrovirus-related Pol polyprotein from transposon 412 [Trichonephila clavipes]|nr:retrovirus-related Pol polyprotein from transposon 412 [Trichonephila clavipes]
MLRAVQECIRYKATNQKPVGLLQTPVPAQRFESIAIDLLVPLPETTEGNEVDFHRGGLQNKMDPTAAYLTFARELRTLDQVNTDLRSVIHNDNFVPEFTPYLKRFEGYMSQIKENIEMSQDCQKTYADKSRRPSPDYKVNDLVWVKTSPIK